MSSGCSPERNILVLKGNVAKKTRSTDGEVVYRLGQISQIEYVMTQLIF
jgi:hypothetical protein